jgi:hypothetical protein
MPLAQIDAELLLNQFAKAWVQEVLDHRVELGAVAKIGNAIGPAMRNDRRVGEDLLLQTGRHDVFDKGVIVRLVANLHRRENRLVEHGKWLIDGGHLFLPLSDSISPLQAVSRPPSPANL